MLGREMRTAATTPQLFHLQLPLHAVPLLHVQLCAAPGFDGGTSLYSLLAQLVLACSWAAEKLSHRCCEMPHSLWGCPKHMLSSARRGTWPVHPQLNLPLVLCARGGSSATFSTSGCCFLWTYSRCCCLLGAEPKPWQSPACFGIPSNSPGPDSIALVFATESAWSRTNNIHSPSPVPK